MNTEEILDGLPVNKQTLPLILAMAVSEINKSPVDYRTRLRTYDQFVDAIKDHIEGKQH